MRTTTWLWIFGVAALTASVVVSPDQAAHGPVICPFRLATGLPCPGCGLVRSFVACAHGDLASAFAFNLFGPIAFLATLIFVGWYGAELASRRGFGFTAALARGKTGLWVVAVSWITWGIVRFAQAAGA